MKKLLSMMAVVALMFTLTACKEDETIDNGGEPIDKVFEQLESRVEEVEEGRILVDSELGKIWFSYENTSDLEAGDIIKVTYESGLMESDPMQGTMVEYEMVTEYVAPLTIDMTASEIVQHLVHESGAEFGGSMEDVITDDNRQWFLGAADYPEFLDSAVYAPMMNVDVSLIVVVQTSYEDAEGLSDLIMESIDPTRLVCVTFDLEEDVVVETYGDWTVLIINKMYKQEIHDAFVSLQQ